MEDAVGNLIDEGIRLEAENRKLKYDIEELEQIIEMPLKFGNKLIFWRIGSCVLAGLLVCTLIYVGVR